MKNPLTFSGIKYIYARSTPFQDQPMVDNPNPFSALSGFDQYHISFWERLVLTNRVFMGKHFDWYLSGHGSKGVIDLLLFPLISRVMLYKLQVSHDMSLCSRFFTSVIAYPLEISRRILSIALTLVVSPLVLLVHFAFKSYNMFTKNIEPDNQKRFMVFGNLSAPLSDRHENKIATENFAQHSVLTGVRAT